MRNRSVAGRRNHTDDFPQIPELLTTKDLEGFLKIDVKTIYSYVQRGLIPYVKIQSNVRFVKQQIAESPLNGQSFAFRKRQAGRLFAAMFSVVFRKVMSS